MKLLISLTLAACFAILPSCTTAEEVWKKGNKVAAFFICREEKSIMEIALADSKSRDQFIGEVIKKRIGRECVALRPPVLFIVDEVIGSYKDYEKSNTTILKIVPPVNNGFIGYIVARGSPEISKGI
tara:strand:+ start:133 stop:513 length:381 start_codon:yes stop_codon:yes gene_type:complete